MDMDKTDSATITFEQQVEPADTPEPYSKRFEPSTQSCR